MIPTSTRILSQKVPRLAKTEGPKKETTSPPSPVLTIHRPTDTEQPRSDQKIRTLTGLFATYFSALRRDKGLRGVLRAKVVNAAGDGLVLGGAIALTAVIAVSAPYIVAIAIPLLRLPEVVVFAIPFLRGQLKADEQSHQPSGTETSPKAAARRLSRSVRYDLAAGGLLLIATIGAGFGGWGAVALFVLTIGISCCQARGKGIEASSFSQLRWVYGKDDTRHMYHKLRDSVSSLETLFVGMTYALTATGAVLGIWLLAASCPPLVPFLALGLVVSGTTMAAAPKLVLAAKVQKEHSSQQSSIRKAWQDLRLEMNLAQSPQQKQ